MVNFYIENIFTLSWTIYPAAIGAKRPVRFAKQLVNDIKIPAKRGDISKWFTLKPE